MSIYFLPRSQSLIRHLYVRLQREDLKSEGDFVVPSVKKPFVTRRVRVLLQIQGPLPSLLTYHGVFLSFSLRGVKRSIKKGPGPNSVTW